LVGEDLSEEHAWQFNQEFRLESKFQGPLNFTLGGNYLHYETEENYYVFINALTLLANDPITVPPNFVPWVPNVTDNLEYLHGTARPDLSASQGTLQLGYIDPNPLATINGQGHNYFRSDNPYNLNSYAMFGEANYSLADDLKITTGIRWTEDQKHFVKIPSEVLVAAYGYPSSGTIDQQWDQFTGRAVLNWTPKLDFTDQTLAYASYSHGYKAGGANPPAAILTTRVTGNITNPIHPLTFKPEFIDAFELGTKNTLLDGAITFNASAFYYNYEDYQISEIVDRTAINLNFDAHVKGAELEATYEPVPGLKFNFAGGWEDARLAKGSKSIDLMDRTAGHEGWMVIKPFPNQASNCVLPSYVALAAIEVSSPGDQFSTLSLACGDAYVNGSDPLTHQQFVESPSVPNLSGYPGYDPISPTATNNGAGPAPNNGVGFYKDLSGNEMPNAPPFTMSLGAEFSLPLTHRWVGTFHSDFYWQSNSYWRIFNDMDYDKLRGYKNVNLALIFTSSDGLQVMFYGKNIFDTTAITGAFLNSDDTALTTNIFLTDPRLFGVRITKNW
jgi:outer membrane receptor protein involved in Fe transport